MNNKLVSVAITTYNREKLLSRCLRGVLEQTYNNLEVIIVDDCSSDDTKEIIGRYRENDSRIKYFRNDKNEGNAYSRNIALKNCAGYYIAFLDDDDEWVDCEKLNKQVAIFENDYDQRLGIVCTGIIRHSLNGVECLEKAIVPKNIKEVVLSGGLIHNSTALIRKKIISEVGVFDLDVQRGVDSEFFRRIIVIYGYNVHFMSDITCKYYEDGLDRMSLQLTEHAMLKSIRSHFVNFSKYKKYYFIYPKSAFKRARSLFGIFYKLFRMKYQLSAR